MVNPLDIDTELPKYYRHDGAWCSDFGSKVELLKEILSPQEYAELVERYPTALSDDGRNTTESIDVLDARIKRWFSEALPLLLRWVIERRSGLWVGAMAPTDYASVAEELGLSPAFAEACYKQGIALLKQTKDGGII